MAIDKEKQVVASVILSKEVHEKIKQVAKKNKRTASSQMAFVMEKYLEDYSKKNNE